MSGEQAIDKLYCRMRIIVFLLVIAFVGGAIIHEPVNVHTAKMSRNHKSDIDREIIEALNEIKKSRDTIVKEDTPKMHIVMTKEEIPETMGQEIESFFEGMLDAVRNSHIPFISKSTTTNQSEDISHNHTNSVMNKINETENGIMAKTRDELKKDVDVLRGYYSKIRSEFDEWVISNKHQNTKSIILGASSALVVLVFYYLVCKCCLRRSRMRHLSAFANDGFSMRNGDNDPLLPTKHRRYPSNSDEDI